MRAPTPAAARTSKVKTMDTMNRIRKVLEKQFAIVATIAIVLLLMPMEAKPDNPRNVATMRISEFRFPSNGNTEVFTVANQTLNFFRLDFTLIPISATAGDAKGFGWKDSTGVGGAFLLDNNCPVEMQVAVTTPVCRNETIVAGKEYDFSIVIKSGSVALYRHTLSGTVKLGEFTATYTPPFTLQFFHQRTGVIYRDVTIKEQ